MSSPAIVGEVIAHFHDGPLDQPGVTRVLSADQLEYRFIDDVSGRTGAYRAANSRRHERISRCFQWEGWRA